MKNIFIRIHFFTLFLISDSICGQTRVVDVENLVKKVLNEAPIIDGHNGLSIQYRCHSACPRVLDDYRLNTITSGHIGRESDLASITSLIEMVEDATTFLNILQELVCLRWIQSGFIKVNQENFLRVFETIEQQAIELHNKKSLIYQRLINNYIKIIKI